jgi:hypothetical protein
MVRSFLTRLFDSVTRVVLLVPCLLACLACATSFPIENLEEGMTHETVRAEFGEPESIEAKPGLFGDSCWRYVHEEQSWLPTLLPLAWAVALVAVPLQAAMPSKRWNEMFVEWRPVLVYFKAGKIVYSELIGPVGYYVGEPDDLCVPPMCTPDPPPPWNPNQIDFTRENIGWYHQLSFSELTCEAVQQMRRYVSEKQVAVQSTPSLSNERISFLDRYQPVKVLGVENEWCHVVDDSGSGGWVACVFLKPTPR